MSIAIMTEVWKDAPVAGTELLMLLALADSANDDRECWPSFRHLQHKVRVSRPQVKTLLNKLIAAGLIEKTVKGGKGTKGRESNLYKILSMTGVTGEPGQGLQETPVKAGTGVTGEPLIRHSESSTETIAGEPAAQSDPKPKSKTERPRNPIFDAVALGSFQLANVNGDKTLGARIGRIVSWLKDQEDVTAERIAQFYEWYSDQNPRASAPKDPGKFAEWWAKFDANGAGADDPYADIEKDLFRGGQS